MSGGLSGVSRDVSGVSDGVSGVRYKWCEWCE